MNRLIANPVTCILIGLLSLAAMAQIPATTPGLSPSPAGSNGSLHPAMASGGDDSVYGGAASGMRGGLSLPKRRLSGTWETETPMRTEKSQVAEPQGREYEGGDSGAEQRVMAEKSSIKGWSEGAVSRSLIQ
jgi:hypothetical protein